MSYRNALTKSECEAGFELFEKELAKIEKPCREVLVSPGYLAKLAANIAVADFFITQSTAEEDLQNREDEKDIFFNRQALYESFESLTPRQLECLVLCFWDDLSHKQAAEVLGISRQAVGQHLEAAYTIIRKYMTETLTSTCGSALYK